jgi:hypothetical protein
MASLEISLGKDFMEASANHRAETLKAATAGYAWDVSPMTYKDGNYVCTLTYSEPEACPGMSLAGGPAYAACPECWDMGIRECQCAPEPAAACDCEDLGFCQCRCGAEEAGAEEDEDEEVEDDPDGDPEVAARRHAIQALNTSDIIRDVAILVEDADLSSPLAQLVSRVLEDELTAYDPVHMQVTPMECERLGRWLAGLAQAVLERHLATAMARTSDVRF